MPHHSLGAWFGDQRVRGVLVQLLVIGVVLSLGAWLAHNTIENLSQRGLASGFAFLGRQANFAIGESMIPYAASDTYGWAMLVGLLNTLKVGVAGLVLATLLGTLIGLARLSPNWLASRLAGVYVEAVRNVPLLLHLFLWYALITDGLPGPRSAFQPLGGVFLCNRGLVMTVPASHPAWTAAAVALVVAVVAAFWLWRRWWWAPALVPALPLLAWAGLGAPLAMDAPWLLGFNFRGGVTLSPEFLALLLGLVIYTAAFIAEIVRGGILAVSRGQGEAALALGLSRGQVMWLVVLPQALRVMVPPLTSQYLNLLKNSSLAVAIGYPDLVSVLDTTINQTGQAIEGVALIMMVFLAISLCTSALMNWYNRRIALTQG
ncbi:MAG: ABC transporter permease subunit [Rhodospirillaceae bacterium]